MDHLMFSIDEETGNYRYLVSDLTGGLGSLGVSKIKRASRVEPYNILFKLLFRFIRFVFGEDGQWGEVTRKWPCKWSVNLSPIGGPVLPEIWSNRQDAINAEVEWIEDNWL